MSQRNPLPSAAKLNQLLKATPNNPNSCSVDQHYKSIYQKVSNLDDALNLFDQMTQRPPFPSIIRFNQLLHSLSKMKHFSHSLHLFKQMCALRVPVNHYTMSIAIKCCCLCKIGNNFIAIQLLRLMEERGCKPDVVTYTNIIDSLCKDKMIDDAFKLFKEMVFRQGISPNVITYSSLIDGLCNLVDAFCKEGKVEEAENVIDIMIEKGIVPNIVTYSTFIDGYCLRGEMSKAKKFFDSLVFRGLVPNVVSYSSLLNGYCKSLKIDEAMDLFNEITRKEEAVSLFHIMGGSKLNTDIVVYNILIDGASNCGKFDIARLLFHDLTDKGLCHDVHTYSVMISGLCREGLVGDAKELFLKMEESRCPPNNVTYRVLLQGYLTNQHYDDVEMLLH
ncbi:tetratricopeptide-like helical domain-containing protein, partial [Tanacetum coccineum]